MAKMDELWCWPPARDLPELQRVGIQAYAEVNQLSWDDAAQRLSQISLDRQDELRKALSE